MKPLDPKLMKYAGAARRYVIIISIIGFITALLVIAQIISLSFFISPIVDGKMTLGERLARPLPFIVLACVLVIRAALVYYRESLGHRAAAEVIIELRKQVIESAKTQGTRWAAKNGPHTVSLVTRGLDALTPYFVRYLPQLILSSTVTPLTLVVMAYFDLLSAVTALISIPLIPIFMIIVGRLTQEFSDHKLKTMEKLGSQVLDLLSGLVTLRALGRAKGPEKQIRKIGDDYNASTMATLRLAFLSGAILEFIATLSVAVVAVGVGFRLVSGSLSLSTGLIVIMLAPEVYQPLRQVGFQFHASADGVSAFNAALKIIESAKQDQGQTKVDFSGRDIKLDKVSIVARGRYAPFQASGLIRSGKITALSGPSGIGKSSLTMAILGLQEITEGRIVLQDGHSPAVDLSTCSADEKLASSTWIAQQPLLFPGTILSNVLLGSGIYAESYSALPKAEQSKLLSAAKQIGFDQVVEHFPSGWDTPLGAGGIGLSVGQRQRLALTRALLNPKSLVILDEPTAHLDAPSEDNIAVALNSLAEAGAIVLVIAHRKSLLKLANDVIVLEDHVFDQSELEAALIETEETEPDQAPEFNTFFTQGGEL
ncbi:thiol reductant ABC exporter subunit CydD [Boudabousia liubingyangii]|nr:thiol reductant ABC exporter subunit CydD [Boudabousia liubingyangii]